MSDENAHYRNVGYLIEHPQAHAALLEVMEEVGICEDNLGFTVITPPHDNYPLEVNDLVCRRVDTEEPIAIIKPDGMIARRFYPPYE